MRADAPGLVRCDVSVSPSPSATETAPTSLLALPVELLVELVSALDVPSLGPAASSCSSLSRLCDRAGLWMQLSARQGLVVRAGETPQATLGRAAACRHAADQWPSQAFAWEADALGRVSECGSCGRRYDVRVSTAFVDTPTFASKRVTEAAFTARHEAPRSQQSFVALWDSASAAAANN